MKTTLLFLALISFLFFSSDISSQNLKHKYATQGTWEFGGDIFFTTTTEDYSATYENQYNFNNTVLDFAVNANAGFFVIKGLKLGIEPGIEVTNTYRTQTVLKLYFTPEYVFDMKTAVYPYAAGAIGFTSVNPYYTSNYANGFSWGFRLGLKINLAGNSLLNVGLRYYEGQYNTTYEDNYVIPHYSYDIKDKTKELGLALGWSVFF